MKIPKDVGGVEIPNDLRRMAKKLVGRIDSALGRDAAIAGLTLAAAAVIAIAGQANAQPDSDDDASDAPEPPTPPQPTEPPVRPKPPEPTRPPEPPLRAAERVTTFTMPPITPAQTQAVADALGNVAQAALTRFLSAKRGL